MKSRAWREFFASAFESKGLRGKVSLKMEANLRTDAIARFPEEHVANKHATKQTRTDGAVPAMVAPAGIEPA
jgi:hypothetical protein